MMTADAPLPVGAVPTMKTSTTRSSMTTLHRTTSASTPTQRTLEMCPPESVQCVCLPVDGICVPGCDTDADCPDIDGEPLLCDDDGICGPEEI